MRCDARAFPKVEAAPSANSSRVSSLLSPARETIEQTRSISNASKGFSYRAHYSIIPRIYRNFARQFELCRETLCENPPI